MKDKMKKASALVLAGMLLSADSMNRQEAVRPAEAAAPQIHFARAGVSLCCPQLTDEAGTSAHRIAVTSASASLGPLAFRDLYAADDCAVYYDPSSTDACLYAHINDSLYCADAGERDGIPWSYCLYYDSEGQPKLGYIPTSSLTEQYVPTCEYDIPSYSGFKSYMGFDKITSVSSPAYRISRMSAPDEHGLMTYRGRYLIAVGMFFDVSVGDYLDLTLANGSVIRCIVGDRKAMAHTDPSGLFTSANHCMSEFIVSESVLDPTVKKYGDVSCIAAWNSPVVHVTTYQKNALSEPGAAAVAP